MGGSFGFLQCVVCEFDSVGDRTECAGFGRFDLFDDGFQGCAAVSQLPICGVFGGFHECSLPVLFEPFNRPKVPFLC